MKPRLLALRGPLKGMSFSLAEDAISMGRGSDNTISIPDRKMSRHHCVLERAGDEYRLRDLQSTNGTFVNGLPRSERILKEGDQISFAGSVFLFDRSGISEWPESGRIELEEKLTVTASLVRITEEEALRIQREGLQPDHTESDRLASDLNLLLKINGLIASARGGRSFQQDLLHLIFQAFPVQTGGIVHSENTGKDFTVFPHSLDQEAGGGEFRPSRTILETVFREGTPLLSNSLPDDSTLANVESLAGAEIHSVLCVPLRIHGRNLGAIYLENRIAGRSFDQDHLKLLTAIAGAAAAGLETIHHIEWLSGERQRLEIDLAEDQRMLGRSPAMQKVVEMIARVASSDCSVLVSGESGTGKELAARALHRNSPRSDKRFLAVNCATLTDTLLENELFGHEEGAYTGAVGLKKGRLEVADGGTVLLDEIGEMAPELQAKLLRFLEEREFERVGGTEPIRVDVRILASTNRNLEKAISEKHFREDLYYRLNVVSIQMPPLRRRGGDVLLLAEYFLERFAANCPRRVDGIGREAQRYLQSYSWPGNVRELRNAMERAIVLTAGPVVVPDDLPEAVLEVEGSKGKSVLFHDQIAQKKRNLILAALDASGGNLTQAADSLGIHRTYLHRLIRNLGLADH